MRNIQILPFGEKCELETEGNSVQFDNEFLFINLFTVQYVQTR